MWIHRRFVEPRLPPHEFLTVYFEHAGITNTTDDDKRTFLKFRRNSWYYVVYISVAAISDIYDGLAILNCCWL